MLSIPRTVIRTAGVLRMVWIWRKTVIYGSKAGEGILKIGIGGKNFNCRFDSRRVGFRVSPCATMDVAIVIWVIRSPIVDWIWQTLPICLYEKHLQLSVEAIHQPYGVMWPVVLPHTDALYDWQPLQRYSPGFWFLYQPLCHFSSHGSSDDGKQWVTLGLRGAHDAPPRTKIWQISGLAEQQNRRTRLQQTFWSHLKFARGRELNLLQLTYPVHQTPRTSKIWGAAGLLELLS